MNLQIYIPTRNRVDNQVTLRNIPKQLLKNVCLVVHPDEYKAHKELGVAVLATEAQEKGIGATRDWIIDNARWHKHKRIVMMDDDLRLQRRDLSQPKTGPGGRRYFRILTVYEEGWLKAFKWLDRALTKYAHASWGVRALDLESEDEMIVGGRGMHVLGYNLDVVKKVGARFTKGMPEKYAVMEDFNMTLQLLKAGFPNAISLEWRSSPCASNAPGGCSTWRTPKVIAASANRLVNLHKPFVKLREKKAKWEGIEGNQVDVTVQWKRALALGSRL